MKGQADGFTCLRTSAVLRSGDKYTIPAVNRGELGGTLPSDYRFTGERTRRRTSLVVCYGAPFIRRFWDGSSSPDSIVPRPGDPPSLNRYSYVRNNPLRLVDPSGNAECAAGDTACWQSEWEWKDRWYRAHGYDSDGNRINPEFEMSEAMVC